MTADIKPIGRMAEMHNVAERNGWKIVRVSANASEAIVLFERASSPFGALRGFGTAAYAFDGKRFFWGHYDLSFEEASADFEERCSRTFQGGKYGA